MVGRLQARLRHLLRSRQAVLFALFGARPALPAASSAMMPAHGSAACQSWTGPGYLPG